MAWKVGNETGRAAAAALGRIGGASTSDAKKKSSPENGKLGGRPRSGPINWTRACREQRSVRIGNYFVTVVRAEVTSLYRAHVTNVPSTINWMSREWPTPVEAGRDAEHFVNDETGGTI